jgi:hypothetical protein
LLLSKQKRTCLLIERMLSGPVASAMPIFVPEHALTVERSRLAEFFLLFARFEFALKAAKFAKRGKWGAEVDWKTFAANMDFNRLCDPEGNFQGAVSYLETSPPLQQKYKNGSLYWEQRSAPKSYSRMDALLFFVRGVRNNLVHGAKFLPKESTDPERDCKLLIAAETVISACLAECHEVHKAFDSEAL